MNIKSIPAKSVSYGGKRALKDVLAIVIHYTGGTSDTAENEGYYFAKTNTRAAGAHFFVDREGNIVKSINMNRIAWSVGGAKYSDKTGGGKFYGVYTNANTVSIELCAIATQDASDKQIAATNALIKYIQKKCPNAKAVIRHFDVTGKHCPARYIDERKWTRLKKKLLA